MDFFFLGERLQKIASLVDALRIFAGHAERELGSGSGRDDDRVVRIGQSPPLFGLRDAGVVDKAHAKLFDEADFFSQHVLR